MHLPISVFDDIFLTSVVSHDPSNLRRFLSSYKKQATHNLDPNTCRLTFFPTRDSLHVFSNISSQNLGFLSYSFIKKDKSDCIIDVDYTNLALGIGNNDFLTSTTVFMLLSLLFNDLQKPLLACESLDSPRSAKDLITAGMLTGDSAERVFYFDNETPVPSLYMKLPIESSSKAYTNYSHALISALKPFTDDFYINSDGTQIEMEAVTPSALENLAQNCPPIEIALVDPQGFSKSHNGVYVNTTNKNVLIKNKFLIDNPIKELCYQGVVIFDSLSPSTSLERSNPKFPYIEAIFGYMGSKRRLLGQLLPLFPEQINTFVDLFCGAANVGINAKAKKIVLNDANTKLINLYKTIKSTDPEVIAKRSFELCDKFGLNDKKTRKEGYYKLRAYINGLKDKESKEFYITLYLLICISFFYIFDFKEDGTFVGTAGTATYTDVRKKKLLAFSDRLKSKESPIQVTNTPFQKFKFDSLTKKDFIYADPPYLITDAEYNKYWTEHDETKLYNMLDELHKRGIKFALSNTMALKNKVNEILVDWILRNEGTYTPIKLDISYHTSMWNRKDYEQEINAEVVVVNYDPPTSDFETWTKDELVEILRGRSLLALKYVDNKK